MIVGHIISDIISHQYKSMTFRNGMVEYLYKGYVLFLLCIYNVCGVCTSGGQILRIVLLFQSLSWMEASERSRIHPALLFIHLTLRQYIVYSRTSSISFMATAACASFSRRAAVAICSSMLLVGSKSFILH